MRVVLNKQGTLFFQAYPQAALNLITCQHQVKCGHAVGSPSLSLTKRSNRCSDAPSLLNRSYTITAEIEVPQNAEGMIATLGGRFGGYGLYLLKDKPIFTYNFLDLVPKGRDEDHLDFTMEWVRRHDEY